jgi:hypothetical protein
MDPERTVTDPLFNQQPLLQPSSINQERLPSLLRGIVKALEDFDPERTVTDPHFNRQQPPSISLPQPTVNEGPAPSASQQPPSTGAIAKYLRLPSDCVLEFVDPSQNSLKTFQDEKM